MIIWQLKKYIIIHGFIFAVLNLKFTEAFTFKKDFAEYNWHPDGFNVIIMIIIRNFDYKKKIHNILNA